MENNTMVASPWGTRVVLACLALSTAVGVWAYSRYTDSEKILTRAAEDFKHRPAVLSLQDCLDEVIQWESSCPAMLTLCDHYAPKLFESCLQSQTLAQRQQDCAKIVGNGLKDAHFGYEPCLQRKLSRRLTKICTTLYMVSDNSCRAL